MRAPLACCLAIALGSACNGRLLAADTPPPAAAADDSTKALFAQLDKNGDLELTADEVPPARQELFKRLLHTSDRDGNGALNQSEFSDGLGSKRAGRPLEEPAVPTGDGAPGQNPEKMLERLDKNGDGRIVADEVPDQARGMFERLLVRADKDGDGAITRQELTEAYRPAAPGKPGPASQLDPDRMFKFLDKNGDGKISLEEVPEERVMLRQGFEYADQNADGALSREEFTKIVMAFRRQQGGPPAAASPSAATPPVTSPPAGSPSMTDAPRKAAKQGPGGRPAKRLAKQLAKLDTDGDGRISPAEFAAAQQRRFGKLDADGNGFIDRSEFRLDGKIKANARLAPPADVDKMDSGDTSVSNTARQNDSPASEPPTGPDPPAKQ